MVQALQTVYDLKFTSKIVPTDCDYVCAETLFVENKAAMIINGDWAIDKYTKAHGKDLIIAPLPMSAKTKIHMAPMVSGKFFFLNSRTKGKELANAKLFINFLTSKKQQMLLAKNNRLPALKGSESSPEVLANPQLADAYKALLFGQPMPMDVEMRAIWDAMRPQLQGIMAGRSNPKEAARLMQKDAVQKIKEMKE
jgi:maltose-binding protein MalE